MKTTNLIFFGLVVFAGYEILKNHNIKSALNAMKSDVSSLKNSVMKLKSASVDATATAAPQPTCTGVANAGVVEPTTPIVNSGSAWSNLLGRTLYNEVITPRDEGQLKNYNISSNIDRLRSKAGLNGVFKAEDGWAKAWR